MGKPVHGVSSSLLAAQQRLQCLRNKRRAERIAAGLPVVCDEHGRFPQPVISHPDSVISNLPAHLGWESAAVTDILRSRGAEEPGDRGESTFPTRQTCQPDHSPTRKPANPQTCKLYPDVALGMLRQELATVGRIWLLLQHIDSVGRGWLTFEAAREKLTDKKSNLRVCGWRQLRNLLNQGDGIFWERENGRIWLRSVAKAAAALGIRRLKLQPVALPVSKLLEGMGQVRAHLYASFHSSRDKADAEASPIARDSLTRISHIPQRTQRFYEQRANVKTKHNFAVGPPVDDSEMEVLAWHHGGAVLQFNDQDGWHGRKGRTYLAWQLPNNYRGPHAKQPRGRMKRINQELAGLFMKGMTGNGEELVEEQPLRQAQGPVPEPVEGPLPRRFFGNGRLAAKALNRSDGRNIYWKRAGGVRQTQSTNYQLWYVLNSSKI